MPMPDRRQDVLDALRSADSPLSILDIAGQLGLHVNTVRFHLQVLTANGRVEQVAPTHTSPGRPPLMYRAHRGMDPAGPRNYELLAGALATHLGADRGSSGKATEAGRDLGRRLAATSSARTAASDVQATKHLIVTLEELGFAPRRRTSAGASQIELRHCPFLDLVPEHQAVICPLHLGLMQGVLAAQGAQITVEQLEPFAEPDLCSAHLSSPAPTSAERR
jgi:predicted ArsR family transcriptional regulator